MKRWPKILRNKYILTLLIFGVWMTFFDGNNFPRQFNIVQQKKLLQATVNDKKKEIESIKRSLKMLKDNRSLERYAREEYRFKKPNEEIFVIVGPE